MFKASEGATEGTGLSYLDMPYCGPAKIKDISIEEINDTQNCWKVVFGDLTGEDVKGNTPKPGTTHEHVEWSPNESESDEKIQNKVDRVAYIAGKVAPKERVESIQAENWADYIKAVNQLMEQAAYSSKQLYIKAVGNVYNGKARVKFPGYRDFLSVDPDLGFSAKEQASNDEYLEAMASPASPANEQEVVEDVEQAAF